MKIRRKKRNDKKKEKWQRKRRKCKGRGEKTMKKEIKQRNRERATSNAKKLSRMRGPLLFNHQSILPMMKILSPFSLDSSRRERCMLEHSIANAMTTSAPTGLAMSAAPHGVLL